MLFWGLRKYREVALENLTQAFRAEKSPSQIREMAFESFVYLAEIAVGWFRMPFLARYSDRYLAVRNAGAMHREIRERKRGAMLLVSHAGNWEIMALIAGLLIAEPIGTPMHALARPIKNPYLYDRILHLRGLTGLKSIRKIGAVRKALRSLKRNEIVSLLVDQRINEGSVEVTFFGRNALTTSLPALAALRLDTPIFFGHLEQTPDLRFTLVLEGPLPIQKTGDLHEDIRTNTQRFNDQVEADIRRNPGRWLWMHNRWRTRDGAK